MSKWNYFAITVLVLIAILSILFCFDITRKMISRLEQKDTIIQALNNLINELKFRLFKQENPWHPIAVPNVNA